MPPSTPTTVPPKGAGVVPPPPPVPVVVAPPDRIALASGLERRIAAQSAQLDQLSDQYNKAQATADAAAQRLTDLQSQLADAEASATQAQAQVDDAKAALRKTALSAYLGVELAPRIKLGDLQSAYDAGIRQVYSNTAVGNVSNRVKGYHAASSTYRMLSSRSSRTAS
ncbi:MAG TPA: hypothetical protein VF942_13935, partial [Acidimicrobiales bacterium]